MSKYPLTAEQEQVWSHFMTQDRHRREANELKQLLADPEIHPAITYRIIEIFFTPDTESLPYPTNIFERPIIFLNDVVDVIPDEFVNDAGELLLAKLSNKEALDERTRIYYQNAILHLLPRVSEDIADALFAAYRLDKDAGAYREFENSGFEALIKKANIPERFKRLAIDRMHTRISHEQPRFEDGKPVETLLHYYHRFLSELIWISDMPISPELFETEIRYLLEVDPHEPVISFGNFSRAFEILKNPELQLEVLRRELFTPTEGEWPKGSFNRVLVERYGYMSQNEVAFAGRMRLQYLNDPEIVAELDRRLAIWVKSQEEERQQKAQEAATEAQLLSGLKRPPVDTQS